MSINRVILLGNVGRDPEMRSMQNGDQVASFSIATSETWRDKATGERKEATEWHNIVVFNQNLARIVEQYVSKGSRVAVEGKIKTRKWQDREGGDRYTTEIVLDRFDGRISLEGKPGGGGDHSEGGNGTTKSRSGGGSHSSKGDLDDEIPF